MTKQYVLQALDDLAANNNNQSDTYDKTFIFAAQDTSDELKERFKIEKNQICTSIPNNTYYEFIDDKIANILSPIDKTNRYNIKILLLPGEYWVHSGIEFPLSNSSIHLCGCGNSTVLISHTESYIRNIIKIKNKYTTISNLYISFGTDYKTINTVFNYIDNWDLDTRAYCPNTAICYKIDTGEDNRNRSLVLDNVKIYSSEHIMVLEKINTTNVTIKNCDFISFFNDGPAVYFGDNNVCMSNCTCNNIDIIYSGTINDTNVGFNVKKDPVTLIPKVEENRVISPSDDNIYATIVDTFSIHKGVSRFCYIYLGKFTAYHDGLVTLKSFITNSSYDRYTILVSTNKQFHENYNDTDIIVDRYFTYNKGDELEYKADTSNTYNGDNNLTYYNQLQYGNIVHNNMTIENPNSNRIFNFRLHKGTTYYFIIKMHDDTDNNYALNKEHNIYDNKLTVTIKAYGSTDIQYNPI